MHDGADLAAIRARMTDAMLDWDIRQEGDDFSNVLIESRMVADFRVSKVAGPRCSGHRGAKQIDSSKGAFVGIVCKLEGEELCKSGTDSQLVRPGDILVWRSSEILDFEVPEWSSKIIMLVPEPRFDALLRTQSQQMSWCLRGDTAMGTLISSFFTALAGNLDRLDDRAAEGAMEMALQMVGSAFNLATGLGDSPKRTSLYERALGYISRNLDCEDLGPVKIADVHGISVRYLHLLFASNGNTVSGWIREQRLLRCREELEMARKGMSLTEIAHHWGFSDSAHFSRTFKQRFGLPPKIWREQHRPSPEGKFGSAA